MAASFPLAGTVSKAVLLVSPMYAESKELLQLMKFQLYDAGFIVVREEYRHVNAELAEELCVRFDHLPDYMTKAQDATARVIPASMLAPASSMIGNAFVCVVARRDCHAALQAFVLDRLLTPAAAATPAAEGEENHKDGVDNVNDRVTYADLIASIAADARASAGAHTASPSSLPPPAIFVNRTPAGARRAVGRLFPRMLSEDVPTFMDSREFVQARLKASLLPALTELSRQKPAEPLRWLAEHLLMNNPQSPPMVNGGL